MAAATSLKSPVLLFDSYLGDSIKLHRSFGTKLEAIAIEETGFLPEGVSSVYGFFMGEFKGAAGLPGKALYFNQVPIPDLWEIKADNTSAKVFDMNKERAHISYQLGGHRRLVRVVDWLTEAGVPRYSDHYNQYGACFARTIFNKAGQRVSKSYFNASGQEVIHENFVTSDIVVNYQGKVHFFKNKTDFVLFFLKERGLMDASLYINSLSTPFFVSIRMPRREGCDILFWQEPIKVDIPGNMRLIFDGKAPRISKIMVQSRRAYEKLLELGAPQAMLQAQGYVYSFKKDNAHSKRALICTNSDQIPHLEDLAKALPELELHVVAITEMSNKLMSLSQYANVHLYPNVKRKVLSQLFMDCDIYLDINRHGEIEDALQRAFLHNHVILGFKETAHNRVYMRPEFTYAEAEYQALVEQVKALMGSAEVVDEALKAQRVYAMAEDEMRV